MKKGTRESRALKVGLKGSVPERPNGWSATLKNNVNIASAYARQTIRARAVRDICTGGRYLFCRCTYRRVLKER
jgi:hypothetical protein